MQQRIIAVGNSALVVNNEDFISGYEAGKQAYLSASRPLLFTDEEITDLVLEELGSMEHSSTYSTGYIMGWISTFTSKGQRVLQEGKATL